MGANHHADRATERAPLRGAQSPLSGLKRCTRFDRLLTIVFATHTHGALLSYLFATHNSTPSRNYCVCHTCKIEDVFFDASHIHGLRQLGTGPRRARAQAPFLSAVPWPLSRVAAVSPPVLHRPLRCILLATPLPPGAFCSTGRQHPQNPMVDSGQFVPNQDTGLEFSRGR